MKLKHFNPDLTWNHPDAIRYYEEWKTQYPNASAQELILHYISDHDPFMDIVGMTFP